MGGVVMFDTYDDYLRSIGELEDTERMDREDAAEFWAEARRQDFAE